MAHSIQTYKKKRTIINDLDLLVVIGFADEIIRRSPDFVGFKGLAMHWRQSMVQYGPGVIDLKLEQFVTTPDEIREFRALLSAILEKTSRYGATIPAEVLGELVSAPRVIVRNGNYSVTCIEEAIGKLQTLVADNE